MVKTLKITILFVALLLPVCIFVFLKFFGQNKFDIPVYYQTQEEQNHLSCENITFPYVVDLSRFNEFESVRNNSIIRGKTTIVAYLSHDDEESIYFRARLNERLKNEYQLVVFNEYGSDELMGEEVVSLIPNNGFKLFWRCALLNDDFNKWVLLDKEGRIRGYYEANEKEIDRLIVEIKILHENEQKLKDE